MKYLKPGQAPDYLDRKIVLAFLERSDAGYDIVDGLRLKDKFLYAAYAEADTPTIPIYQLVTSRTLYEWFKMTYPSVVFYVVEGSIARVYAFESPVTEGAGS